MDKLRVMLIGLAVLLLLATASAFTVDQAEYALVKRFGKVEAVKDTPGLYFKLPIIDNVDYFDNRILTLDTEDPAKFITSENKYMLVDSFVKWRIVDPVKYYEAINQGGETAAENRLSQVVNAGLREEFGVRTVRDVVAGERRAVMDNLRQKADAEMRSMGIKVVDVRLKRVDYDDAISKDVYKRMISERKRQANQLRSEGGAASEKIRADADKQREVIIAQAFRKAQEIKGLGDSRAAAIYNEAYGKSPEFYSFYRSVEAYKNSFKDKGDMMVLDRNSEFFKYMRQSQ